jgi:hypothetical protein
VCVRAKTTTLRHADVRVVACLIVACVIYISLFSARVNATSIAKNPSVNAPGSEFAALRDCKIFVLDIMRMAHPTNRTPCVRNKRYYDALTKLLGDYEKLEDPQDSVLSLKVAQHGWPELLINAILVSTVSAVNIEDADVVLVDMSCFADEDALRWHGNGGLVGLRDAWQILSQLKRTPAWTVDNGAGFAFMGPHPYSYFGYGEHGPCGLPMCFGGKGPCGLKNSYFLAAEPGQMCSYEQARANSTIVPYNAVTHIPTMKQALEANRTRLVWFRASCGGNNSGKGFRLFLANATAKSEYASNPQVIISCKAVDHMETSREMLTSTFCLVIAGDTPSGRRISEIVIAGCIPVFVGPPWHIRPLSRYVPWDQFSLFIEVNNAARWCPKHDITKDELISLTAMQPLPEGAMKHVVNDPIDIIPLLEAYSPKRIEMLRAQVIAHRSIMMHGGHEPGQASLAPLAIMNDLCTYGKQLNMRASWREEKTRLAGGFLLTPRN